VATHSRRRCRAPPHRGQLLRYQGMRRRWRRAPLHLLVVVAKDELNPQRRGNERRSDRRLRVPTDGARCRGSWRGSQPGGGMHPPSPRGWLPGKVQAILQIYSRSKNTRTLKDLEWFGPPKRNTLRPLRVVLFLGLWMSLSSDSKPPFGPGSFSNGRLPFIEQGGRVHRRWTPTGGPNEDVYYTKQTPMVLQ